MRRRPDIPPPRERLPRTIRTQVFARQNGRCAVCGAPLILGFFDFYLLEGGSPAVDRQREAEPNILALCWVCEPQAEVDY